MPGPPTDAWNQHRHGSVGDRAAAESTGSMCRAHRGTLLLVPPLHPSWAQAGSSRMGGTESKEQLRFPLKLPTPMAAPWNLGRAKRTSLLCL